MEDLFLIREIFKYLNQETKVFYMQDIMELIDAHPDLSSLISNTNGMRDIRNL